VDEVAALTDEQLLEAIAGKVQAVGKGGHVDWQKAAERVITDLRTGALGRITLELPGEFADWQAQAAEADEARDAKKAARKPPKKRTGKRDRRANRPPTRPPRHQPVAAPACPPERLTWCHNCCSRPWRACWTLPARHHPRERRCGPRQPGPTPAALTAA
jgi:hypothetical protein